MYPTIFIFGKEIFLYDILVGIGTFAGAAALLAALFFGGLLNKKTAAAYALSIVLSLPYAPLLRRIAEAESVSEFICGSGSHFMGMVFAFYFIFPKVYKKIVKQYPDEGMKGISAFYFCTQHFFSRLGCYSLGCCFGRPYNGVFAVTFPYGTNPYMHYGEEIPIFPTQLFEAFSMIIVLALTAFLLCKKRKYSHLAFIIGFSAVIFISECFMYRYDFVRTVLGLSLPQICALILIICSIAKMRGKDPNRCKTEIFNG